MIPYASKINFLSIKVFGKELPVQISKVLNERYHSYFPITYLYEQLNYKQVVHLIEKFKFFYTRYIEEPLTEFCKDWPIFYLSL